MIGRERPGEEAAPETIVRDSSTDQGFEQEIQFQSKRGYALASWAFAPDGSVRALYRRTASETAEPIRMR